MRPEERWLAFACHVGGAVGAALLVNLGFLVPLVLWLAKRHESAHVDQHGKEAVNFQLNMLLAGLILYALLSLLRRSIVSPFQVFEWRSFPLVGALFAVNVILSVLAGIEAYNGREYRYPFIIRLIR